MLRDPVEYTAPPIPLESPLSVEYEPRKTHLVMFSEELGSLAEMTTPLAAWVGTTIRQGWDHRQTLELLILGGGNFFIYKP